MTYSEQDIINLALIALGVQTVADMTEDTLQRQLGEALFPICRDRLLASGYFDIGIRRAVFDTPTATPDDWRYLYRYDLPAGTLRVLAVYRDPDDCEPLVDWAETDRQLCTDYVPTYAVLAVTADLADFTDLFVDALAALLAVELAVPLTKNAELRAQTYAIYQEKLTFARGYNTAYRQQQDNRMSAAVRARYR